MDVFIGVMIGVFMSIIGIGLAAFIGGEGKALSERHKDRRLLSAVRLMLGLFIVWCITTVALIFNHSKWYMVPLGMAILYLYVCAVNNSVEEDKEIAIEAERNKLIADYETIVSDYETLLEDKTRASKDFAENSLLPASKEQMAIALQFVYWFRLMQLDIKDGLDELYRRYLELANFIEDDDAVFMNEFTSMVNSREEAIRFVKEKPDEFTEKRQRMSDLYKELNDEQDRLIEEWDASFASFGVEE